jgi:hypothetical protein
MTNEEIEARLFVLEAFVLTALGMYLANTSNDPTYEKATALLDFLRGTARSNAAASSPNVQAHAAAYSDYLTNLVSANLRAMRGETGHSH